MGRYCNSLQRQWYLWSVSSFGFNFITYHIHDKDPHLIPEKQGEKKLSINQSNQCIINTADNDLRPQSVLYCSYKTQDNLNKGCATCCLWVNFLLLWLPFCRPFNIKFALFQPWPCHLTTNFNLTSDSEKKTETITPFHETKFLGVFLTENQRNGLKNICFT